MPPLHRPTLLILALSAALGTLSGCGGGAGTAHDIGAVSAAPVPAPLSAPFLAAAAVSAEATEPATAGVDRRVGSLSVGCTPGLRGRPDDRRFRLAASAVAPSATSSAAVSHCALPLPAVPEAALPVQGPEVIVKLTVGARPEPVAAAAQATVVGQFGQRPIWRLRLPVGTKPRDVAEQLRLRPDVRFAEVNEEADVPAGYRNGAWAIGTDAGAFVAQWAPGAMGLGTAQSAGLTGQGVRIAVLDTGIDPTHPALAGRLARRPDGTLLGRDFVDDDADPSESGSPLDAGFGHGTHVAGLVALAAPGAALMPLRVLDRAGRGNVWVLAEALMWAVDPDGNPQTDDGAHLVNLSLGTRQPTRLLRGIAALASCEFDDDDDDDDDDVSPTPEDRARCANGFGAAVLSAAGNDGSANIEVFPAAEQVAGARAVAASTAQGTVAPFSNRGGWIRLAAPGDRIVSTVPGGAWATWSGTSMAAPLVTGTAALLLTLPSPSPRPGLAGLRQWDAEDLLKTLEDRSARLCGSSIRQVYAAGLNGASVQEPWRC